MCLLDLIEQYHAVRFSPDSFGQLTTFLISYISGRRSDQTRDRILLHVLTHIDTYHIILIVEQCCRQTLGQFRLDGILPARRGVPQIEVTFDIDANGIVNVSAKDLGTGKEQHITITSGSNMSKDDIDKAVKEAAAYEAEDKKKKEAIDTRNEADSMAFQTEKAMEEVGDKIDANDKAAVEADLNALKEAINKAPAEQMTDAQVEEIKAAKEKLMNSAQKLFAKVYEQAQAAQGAAGAQGQAGPQAGQSASQAGYGDDVVDGDYKEV